MRNMFKMCKKIFEVYLKIKVYYVVINNIKEELLIIGSFLKLLDKEIFLKYFVKKHYFL